MNIKKSVKENKVIIVVFPTEGHAKSFRSFMKKIKNNRVCIVTVNKGYHVVREECEKSKVATKKFCFIDCVTKTVTKPINHPGCYYVSSPSALTELSLAVTKCMKITQIIFLDSFGTFSAYHSPKTLTRFVHSLTNKVRNQGDAVLIIGIAQKDKEGPLFKEIAVFADEIISAES